MSWTPPKDDYNPLATMQHLPIRTTVPLFEESRDQKDSRMEWWREARFGMFIHWGLYSIPAGEWNRYEYLYNTTPLAEVSQAHTPLTLRAGETRPLRVTAYDAAGQVIADPQLRVSGPRR